MGDDPDMFTLEDPPEDYPVDTAREVEDEDEPDDSNNTNDALDGAEPDSDSHKKGV